jgi:acetoin utilization protein AcuB
MAEAVSLGDVIDALAAGEDVFVRWGSKARDVMATEPAFVTLDHTIDQTRRLMDKHSVRHMPLVEEGAILGIISRRDLSRLATTTMWTDDATDADRLILAQRLGGVYTPNPTTAQPDASVFALAQTMLQQQIGCVLIAGPAKELLGLVTSSDVLQWIVRLEWLGRLRTALGTPTPARRTTDMLYARTMAHVSDVSTPKAPRALSSTPIGVVVTQMQRSGLRYVLVMDDADELVGIVSDRDIMRNTPTHWRTALTRGHKAEQRDHFFLHFEDPEVQEFLKKPVEIVMTHGPMVVNHDLPTAELAKRFLDMRVGGAPVRGPDGKLQGIVTETDLLRAFVKLRGDVTGQRAN